MITLLSMKIIGINELYIGRDCNEMIICSGKYLQAVNQLHLHEEKLSKQIPTTHHHGEM